LPIGRFLKSKSLGGNQMIFVVSLIVSAVHLFTTSRYLLPLEDADTCDHPQSVVFPLNYRGQRDLVVGFRETKRAGICPTEKFFGLERRKPFQWLAVITQLKQRVATADARQKQRRIEVDPEDWTDFGVS
jgi:hypothetical protein